MASEKKHSPEIERALIRQNASFAVQSESDLADLIHMARCAADRLHPVPQETRDVLAALVVALNTQDRTGLQALHKPALKQIAEAHTKAEEQLRLGEGPWPVGFDASAPHLRVHGSQKLIGARLLDLVQVFRPEVDHPLVERNGPSREFAEHFADFVQQEAGHPPFEKIDAASVRAKMLELCPRGPINDLETDAVRVGEALGMSRKEARSAVDQAAKSRSV